MDVACPIANGLIVDLDAIGGLVAGRVEGILGLEEGCDAGGFAGFGAGCEGLKKSCIDLLFAGGMIHLRTRTSPELTSCLLSSESVGASLRLTRLD